jgi:molybdopterin synthase sulfur carrier subunit
MAAIVTARGLQTGAQPQRPMPASNAEPPATAPTTHPTVRVRLFAALREAMGWSEQQVAAATSPATPLDLWRQLDLAGAWQAATGATPAVEALPEGVRVAINQQFAGADTPLADGDELAFLPPISGG